LPVPYTFRFRLPAVILNPRLSRLQPCSFERLRHWFADVTPNPVLVPISLSIVEPRHPTPTLVADALAAGMSGLANYPTTIGPARAADGNRPVRIPRLPGTPRRCRVRPVGGFACRRSCRIEWRP
jgi:hypothetical protein